MLFPCHRLGIETVLALVLPLAVLDDNADDNCCNYDLYYYTATTITALLPAEATVGQCVGERPAVDTMIFHVLL